MIRLRPTLGGSAPRLSSLALLAALAAAGCRRSNAPAELEVPAPTVTATKVPADQALPNELAEGTEKAFGLTLPRGLTVRGRYTDTLYATGEVPADKVATYIRQRVKADKVETGPNKTLFPKAMVRGQPGVDLEIQVISRVGNTELTVHNLSLVKATPGLTDEERWRAAGLKPDGTPLDPTHLH